MEPDGLKVLLSIQDRISEIRKHSIGRTLHNHYHPTHPRVHPHQTHEDVEQIWKPAKAAA